MMLKSKTFVIIVATIMQASAALPVFADDSVFPPGQAESKAKEAILRAQAEKQAKDAAEAKAAAERAKETKTDTGTGTDTRTDSGN